MRPSRCLLAAALLCGAGLPARATCGSANCFLVSGSSAGLPTAGALRLDLSFRFVDQSRKLAGSHSVGEVLAPKIDFENREIELDHHREVRTQNTLAQLDLAYGVTSRLALTALLPLVNQRDHEHVDEAGTPEELFTREDGASGFGDVRLGAAYALRVTARGLLLGRATLSLPTGAYRLHDHEGAINEPTIQPGTGALGAIVGLSYARQLVPGRLEWFAAGSHRRNAENDLDYRFGAETVAGAGFERRVGERVQWSVELDLRHTARDEYLGEGVAATGATLLHVSPGIRLNSATGVGFYSHVQLPLRQRVHEAQLAARTAWLVGLVMGF
ncbi:MAG TPA: transporter [Candidatus Polarisedimenticolaceae bacterium]|nr:transporter [Candidatus Polarisedimenticolaceae bacterium]